MELSGVPYQVMAGHRLEEGVACPKNQRHEQEKKPTRPQPEKGALKCPRCASTNTKFCYYNNYSLSQPRYFCKGCRRYWTHGGSLRNVPVGGGCRKNKRSTTPSCSKKTAQDQDPLLPPPPPLPFDPSDLTLAFATQSPIKPQFEDSNHNLLLGNNTAVSSMVPAPANGFHDVLRTGFIDISSMYYGGNNGEDTRLMSFEEGMVAGATASSEASQGSYKALDGRDDKMPMGLPWQLDAGSMLDNSARDCSWNGVGSSAWQGLINSSLL